MTFKELQSLIEQYNIPKDVHLTSDSGWECDATEMNGVFYNRKKNEIVFTQETSHWNWYARSEDWMALTPFVTIFCDKCGGYCICQKDNYLDCRLEEHKEK